MTHGLFQAVHDCRYLQAKFLLESGININCKNTQGESLLISALLKISDVQKRQRMMKWLMTIGADVAECDEKYGRDSVTWAAYLNRTEDVKVILRSKEEDVKLSNVDIYGRSALHYATLHDNVEVVGMLAKRFQRYRVSVDIRDLNQITPYIIAVKLRFTDCARVLLEVGGASPSQVTEGFFKSSNIWNGLEEFRTLHQSNQYKLGNGKHYGLPLMVKSSDTKHQRNGLPSLMSADTSHGTSSASRIPPKRERTAKTSKSKNTKVSFRSMQDFSSEDFSSNENAKIRKSKGSVDRLLPDIYRSMESLKHPNFMLKPGVEKGYQSTVMPAVFNMLSQQVCDSYVPPVRVKPVTPPPPPPQKVDSAKNTNKKLSLGILGNVSKFAVMLKRKTQKKIEID